VKSPKRQIQFAREKRDVRALEIELLLARKDFVAERKENSLFRAYEGH
jgi:hypothetical protein